MVQPRIYSEKKAADLIGVNRATLGAWRKGNKLRPDAILTGLRPQGRGSAVTYDANLIDEVADGKATLFPVRE